MSHRSSQFLSIAAAVVLAACGPSTAEQAADRLDAAWEAAADLDVVRAQAELDAAESLSPETVDPVRSAIESRIAAIEAWNAAEVSFGDGLYLDAIADYENAAEIDDFFAEQAQDQIQASEEGFVEATLRAIASGTAQQTEEGYVEAFETLATGLSEFPDNELLLSARGDVAAVYFPLVAADVEAQLGQDAPEEAQSTLNSALLVLGSVVPGADELSSRITDAIEEAAEARRIAAQQERQRAAEEQRLAREAAEREREQVFARIGCDRDNLERINRCYDRETYSRLATNRLYLWTVQRDGQRPSLYLGIETRGSSWIFWETARIYVDGRTFTINAGYFNVRRDNSSRGTWETFIRAASPSDLAMAAEIANANEVYIRYFNDDNVYREHKMSAAQVRAVGNVLAYWSEIS